MTFCEVMMHMQLAGRTLEVELDAHGDATIYDPKDGRQITRVTYSEAGIYRDPEWGYYAYHRPTPDDPEADHQTVLRIQENLNRILKAAGAEEYTDLGLNCWSRPPGPAPEPAPETAMAPRRPKGRSRKLVELAKKLAETKGVSSGPEETPLF
jgi:hypothetical protein